MIITRIPPSPTGKLHIGTARTALFNYLFAKKNGGKMVFRSEDTDKARSTKESEAEIMSGLQWLGITWDNEGEIVRQSERAPIYREYLEKIIANGGAYVSREESKNTPGEMVEVVRLKNPNKVLTFNDLIRGDITFDTTELGDIVIARNLDDALYHFTVVVDDYLMGVTHVIRGEDHISNTPRQILIQEALGIERPIYAHLPLILAPDRSKMSKRHGAVSIESYRELGYTKDAILNYLALLGWNPGTDQELFTLAELVEKFEVTQIQKSGAVFDIKKFNWFNKEYLRRMSAEEFMTYLDLSTAEGLPKYFDITSDSFTRLLPTIQERISIRQEAIDEIKAGEYDFVFVSPTEYTTDMLKWKNDPDASAALPRLEKAAELLKTADFSTPDTIKAALWGYAEEVGKGELFSPLRIALSGKAQSPDPFTIAYIVGLEETLRRIATACDKIKG
ncbi:glutamate--tRNA ligase [Candidatus Kaiserbacteria bacterium RIFCSPLOWO2_02_FULL_45_11b]|uniref:Glutamate--tRNA ligase n=1 Tax=Candidatus Kaiserbacteria bacterium RIFCSPLOWO2_12_FULL_45_26 TaxID=1798525 RepID=A0A1F6FGZ3_9BACT|nr:MAG: glutamate--tRNA ligase [Candidatus Kaiserbacteria bacterium RIFCSPHIGHO2_12_45_16]OGG69967.1 MAG: glutamate--tRNA ligase [Candidatus Kaiserbacteria bacterium RIFCSPLOWO2_01_FULL_45_25]OGG81537.1 MAG: glutamate--tRNA ligase [Candidatus Kaiserbacteria bacterium RIFCSPLOWO2_02_FULL_45_11b]OGG85128.1 MAG: glutamate--tRNA ligase [Candidatus Kaiserbacteria bacterium RIFCSPLOWO2_12_FULL_45_26]